MFWLYLSSVSLSLSSSRLEAAVPNLPVWELKVLPPLSPKLWSLSGSFRRFFLSSLPCQLF